jgi:hypothetical protein
LLVSQAPLCTQNNQQANTFRIDAIDASNNPASAQFIWNVLTVAQGIEQLTQTVDSMGLQQAIANSLKGSLH